MSSLRNGAVACAMLCLGGTAVGENAGITLVDDMPHVTTDSPEYCRNLAAMIDRDPRVVWTAELRSLADMGTQLCRTGHVRMGIARLRHVWMLGHPVSER